MKRSGLKGADVDRSQLENPEGELPEEFLPGRFEAKRYRTLFLSDIHLGTRNCQAGELIEFLKYHEADTYYLVGDIVDFWRIRKRAHWPQAHNDVVQKMLRKVRKGAHLYFIPGNHDEVLRAYCGNQFGGIELVRDAVFKTADGRKFLVLHGDEFDVIVRYAKWLAYLGDGAYVFSMELNRRLNGLRRKLGMGYWSLSKWLKQRVKSAVSFIGEYEAALAMEARRRGVDGVICGHIHHAAMHEIDGIEYVNAGDWVESCTAIGETHDGQLEIINWRENAQREPALLPEKKNKAAMRARSKTAA